jgi:hypothetical protein
MTPTFRPMSGLPVLVAACTMLISSPPAVSAEVLKRAKPETSAAAHPWPQVVSTVFVPSAATFLQPSPKPPAKQDPLWDGLLIGAGVGALFGLIPDHYDDCEECHDSLYGSIAVGAGVGVLIDFLRRPKSSSAPMTRDRVRLTPTFGRGSVGLRGRLAW